MRRTSYLPVILIALSSLLLDCYVFQGIRSVSISFNEDGRLSSYIIFWFISLSILLAFIFNFYRAISTGKFTLLFNAFFNAFLTLFVTKIVFALTLLGEDIYRAVAGLLVDYPPRSQTISMIGALLSSIPLFAFIFGVTRGKYHYKVKQTILYFDDLPENFDGFTITQISDVHAGSFDSLKGVQRGINLINAQKSDLVVFTGDLVNNKASEIEPWIPVFKQIEARYGKFSVLGNHDYGDYTLWESVEEKANNLISLKENHQKIGFKLLLDEHVQIEKGGQVIALLGIENWGWGFGQRG